MPMLHAACYLSYAMTIDNSKVIAATESGPANGQLKGGCHGTAQQPAANEHASGEGLLLLYTAPCQAGV